jgi:sugar phosphate permease
MRGYGGLIVGAGLSLLDYWFPSIGWTSRFFAPGILAQAAAVCIFVIYAWPRVLPTAADADWKRKA